MFGQSHMTPFYAKYLAETCPSATDLQSITLSGRPLQVSPRRFSADPLRPGDIWRYLEISGDRCEGGHSQSWVVYDYFMIVSPHYPLVI